MADGRRPGTDRGGRADDDRFELARFVRAQDDGQVFTRALAEVRAGAKRSHWMWFVYPQIAGLGGSPMARHYAIRDTDEAVAYLAHPVLGPRLLDAARAAGGTPGHSAEAVFGGTDAMKLRSSMTLFVRAAAAAPTATGDPEPQWMQQVGRVCQEVLDRFFTGLPDPVTLRLLSDTE